MYPWNHYLWFEPLTGDITSSFLEECYVAISMVNYHQNMMKTGTSAVPMHQNHQSSTLVTFCSLFVQWNILKWDAACKEAPALSYRTMKEARGSLPLWNSSTSDVRTQITELGGTVTNHCCRSVFIFERDDDESRWRVDVHRLDVLWSSFHS